MRPLIIVLALSMSLGGVALAHAPVGPSLTASKTTAAASTAVTTPAKPRTAASLQCSKDADAKNIHGKPRKSFMSSCKKAAAKT